MFEMFLLDDQEIQLLILGNAEIVSFEKVNTLILKRDHVFSVLILLTSAINRLG